MLKGVCIDDGNSTVLKPGETYFLFPNGNEHAYVSKFPNKAAHKGCFQMMLFKEVAATDETEEPKNLDYQLDRSKVYKAKLVQKKSYSDTELKEYYVRLFPLSNHPYELANLKENCYFYDRYNNGEFDGFRGCFPLEWFADFEEVELQQEEIIHNEEPVELEEKTLEELAMEYTVVEQLSIFDF
ncbi:hypothetical protein E2329_23020 [Salmonella enterica subsp. enterica]|nr:hypothetical protein [Salmonella enterica subsp. enterica serovar Paratyphi A]